MSAFFEWLQSRLHAECDTVIAFYDQDRRLLTQAQSESAAAHHEAEIELAAAREVITGLQAKVVRERARADQAEAALEAARSTVTEPPDLTRPHIAQMDALTTALLNTVLIRICLRNKAIQHVGSHRGEHLHLLADLYQARVWAAQEALHTPKVRA